MAAFTSLGVGSGLDLNTIVTQLVALERRPLQLLQNTASELGNKVSLYGKVSSLFSALQDASNKLADTSLWSRSVATSSNAAAVAVSGGSGAAVGSYGVTVQSLANNQTVAAAASLPLATSLVGSGTFSLQLGSWDEDETAFSPKAGSSAASVELTDSDTLQTLRDKINALDAGVSATLVTDATGVRLSLRSASSGAENGFRASVIDGDGAAGDGAGLSRFAYDPPAGGTGLALSQAATDARATVNGIPVQSTSNELSGVVEGLTLTLQQESATPVNLSVSRDREAIVTGIKTFAEAYNALASYLNGQTKYDPTAKTGGPLQGDSAATSLQSQLRSVLGNTSGASSVFTRLSDIGLQSQRDGTVTVNEAKLRSATGNLAELKKAFANADATTPANNGFARRYATLASQALSVDGTLTTRTQSLQKMISKNTDEQARLNERVDRFQQRLVAQYTVLDANVSRLNALSSYVTQQIAQYNRDPA